MARLVQRGGFLAGLSLLMALVVTDVAAQVQPVRVGGGLRISGESYTSSGFVSSTRPGQTGIATGRLNIQLMDQLTLPLSFYLSTESSGFEQPFNQFGMSPEWKWVRVHAGYFSTRFSEFSLADARLLGGGVEIRPGIFRFGFVQGRSQRAVEADSVSGLPGLYKQKTTAVTFGLGDESGWHFLLSGLKVKDDTTTVRVPGLSTPKENVVASARFGAALIPRKLTFRTEVAFSAFTDDVTSDSLSSSGDFDALVKALDPFLTPTSSTRVDGAVNALLDANPSQHFGVQLEGRYVGPGYESLGATQIEADILDLLISPRINVGRFRMSARVGVRSNNVADTRIATQRRTLVAANATVRASRALSISGEFANYGLNASRDLDTTKVTSISRLFGVTPTLSWSSGSVSHSATLGLRHQEANQSNRRGRVELQAADTKNNDVTASYSVSLPSGLSLSTMVAMSRSDFGDDLTTTVLTLSESFATRFLQGRVRVSGSAAYNRIKTTTTDNGFQFRTGASYEVHSHGQVEMNIIARFFKYGQEKNGEDGFSEFTTRLGYNYRF